jgi:plasmid maintenance system killer protein
MTELSRHHFLRELRGCFKFILKILMKVKGFSGMIKWVLIKLMILEYISKTLNLDRLNLITQKIWKEKLMHKSHNRNSVDVNPQWKIAFSWQKFVGDCIIFVFFRYGWCFALKFWMNNFITPVLEKNPNHWISYEKVFSTFSFLCHLRFRRSSIFNQNSHQFPLLLLRHNFESKS